MANFPIENRVKLTYNIKEVIIMSEICLDCWNKENGTNHKKYRYVLSKELCLCESCGKYKRVIIVERDYLATLLICLFFPINIFYLLYKIVI